MPFIDRDEDGEKFVNIVNRVGTTGNRDDVLAIQAMLEVIYDKKPWSPVKHITVSGKPAKDTIILIKYFQQTFLNRQNPQGYINRSSGQHTQYSTIWQLNRVAEMNLIAKTITAGLIKYLKARCPELTGSLLEGATDVYESKEDRQRSQRERPTY